MSAPDQRTENNLPKWDWEASEDGDVTIFPTDVDDDDLKTHWITADESDCVRVGGMR